MCFATSLEYNPIAPQLFDGINLLGPQALTILRKRHSQFERPYVSFKEPGIERGKLRSIIYLLARNCVM